MASSQIAYAGGDVVVTVNAIDSTGAHVAVTGINASRLSINGTANAAVPAVANPDTGIYVLTWSSLSPATAEGDSIVALIDGSVAGTAFSTYGIPVKVVASQRGTDNASTFNASTDTVVVGTNNDKAGYSLTTTPPTAAQIYAEFTSGSNEDAFKTDVSGIAAAVAALNDLSAADVRTAIGLASANLDTQLGDIPTVTELNARTKATADYFDPATDTVANVTTVGTVTNAVETDTASRNASKADVSSLASSADLTTVDTVVDAIKVVTDKLDDTLALDGAVYQFTTNALENAGGTDPASIYTYFTTSSRADSFKSDVSSLATSADLAVVDGVVDAIKSTTDNFVFTISGQVDANTVSGGGTISESSIRSALGMSAADLDTQLSGIDAKSSSIKTKTDQLAFTVSGQVDANSLSGSTTPAEVYDYFVDGTRENQFKDGSVQGAGAISHTVTISVDGSPASGVDVWVSSDVTGVNVVAGTLYTNNAGQATFLLDAGTYYLWAQRSGTNFTNPQEFTVS